MPRKKPTKTRKKAAKPRQRAPGAGRKPKPVKLHQAEGTYTHYDHGKRHGEIDIDQLDGTMPVKPTKMPAAANKLWDLLSDRLHGVGVLSEIDAPKLEALCVLFYNMQRLQTLIFKTPLSDVPSIDFERVERRYTALSKQFDSLGSEFGLSPVDRARLRAMPSDKDDKDDDLREFGIVS